MSEDVSAPALTARVTVSRKDDRDVQQRQIYARIDDGPTKMLVFGNTFTVDVAPGAHTLKANNTLYWKTVRFTIEAGEHLEFAMINQSSKLAFGFLAVLGAGPLKLTIEKRQASS